MRLVAADREDDCALLVHGLVARGVSRVLVAVAGAGDGADWAGAVIHRGERAFGCVAALEREAIGAAAEVEAHKRGG